MGTLVSLIIHALLVLGFVRSSHSTGQGGGLASAGQIPAAHEFLLIPLEEPHPTPPDPGSVRLGLAEGAPDARAWLGFTNETEHLAPQGPLDQSAMTLAPPGSTAQGDGVSPTLPESAPPEPATAADVLRPHQAQPQQEALPELPIAADPAERRPDWSELAQTAQRLGEALRDAITLAMDAVEEPPQIEAPEVAEQAQLAPPPETSPGATPRDASAEAGRPRSAGPVSTGGSDLAGIVSDRESIAAAIRAAPAIRPGRVLAAEGLEIQTSAPRWSYTTMATRRPRNPTVEIFFGADGRVRRAGFVRDGGFIYNTGHDDVDQPLLNAIYSWTARGKAIDELAAGQEQGAAGQRPEVRLLITVILVG